MNGTLKNKCMEEIEDFSPMKSLALTDEPDEYFEKDEHYWLVRLFGQKICSFLEERGAAAKSFDNV